MVLHGFTWFYMILHDFTFTQILTFNTILSLENF